MGNYKHYKNLMDAYEQRLTKSQWLGGQGPTDEDNTVCKEMTANGAPTIAHPHTFAWYSLCCKFQDCITSTCKAAPAPKQAKGKKAPAAKKEEVKVVEVVKPVEVVEDDLDEDDLFAEDSDETAAAEAAGKAPLEAKSLIIYEVKPVDDETDLQVLGKRILSEIVQDGLFWKTEFKTAPIAYGIEKLIIGATIIDAKVSTDDVQEKIEEMDDMVQSVDIQSFNKL